jgi:3-deoxy-D-manno-octulosonic-acid transferase
MLLGPGRPAGKTIWVHALSVGEVIAAAPLVRSLADRPAGPPIVLSVSTAGGYQTARQKLEGTVAGIIFAPYDLPFIVQRVAAWINPGLAVIVETDVWPNCLCEMRRRNVPVILANAKLSDRSFAGYRRAARFAAYLFAMLTKILCQTREDAARFRQLGVPRDRIEIAGNIKFDQIDEGTLPDQVVSLRRILDAAPQRPVWVAGSTHPGEEDLIRMAFSKIRRTHADLLLIVAPRDPRRAGAVCRLFESAGFAAARLSGLSDRPFRRRAEVVVIDVLGILKHLYALADVALVGGSLLNIRGIGGHNPLEPAAFAKPVLFGPNMKNFKEIEGLLLDARGALRVSGAAALQATVDELLKNRELARRVGRNARGVIDANKGAVARTVAIITALSTAGPRAPTAAPVDRSD